MEDKLILQSVGQAFNYASIALINIRYFDMTQERYEELRRFYLELHRIAIEAGETHPWSFNTLPDKLEDARLLLEFPHRIYQNN